MKPFNPTDYWESRLGREFDLRGVGPRNWGIHFNRWSYRARRRVFLRVVKSLNQDFTTADILDVGAGTGFYIDCWKELGARSLVGLDLTNVAVDRLKSRYSDCSFYRMDIGQGIDALGSARFDWISCMDVLFHIVDDRAYRRAIANAYNLLKPGGVFVFTDGFVDGPACRSEHVVHRERKIIDDLLRDVGFTVVTRRPFLVLLNDPIGPGKPLLKKYWHLLKTVVQRFQRTGAVVGAILYPLELVLASIVKTGPSTKIVLCRRPGDSPDLHRGSGRKQP